jgi:hypothetical protein
MTENKTFVSARHQISIALCLASMTSSVLAQNTASPMPAEVEQAFREVVNNAASFESRSKYATLLVRAGNFEGGIAALEGLLVSPDAPASIRVELGVLYFRLGSYAISESYLRAALDDPRLEPNLKSQAETLLHDVVQRNKASRLSGRLMIGLRTQSNPTSATSNTQVYFLGAPVARGKDAGPKADVDTHFWGEVDHVLDFDKQNEASLVTSLVAYASHYNSVDSYTKQVGYKPFDLTILAGSTGIRFRPMPATELLIRPHLIAGAVMANGSPHFTNTGFGLDGDYRSSESVAWSGAYENTKLAFSSREDMPSVALQGGNRQTVRVSAAIEMAPGRFLITELGYADMDGNVSYSAYREPHLQFSYLFSYAPLVGSSTLPWTTTASVTATRKDYRGPDPIAQPKNARQDAGWRASLIQNMPLNRDLSLQFQLDYSDTSSNIPNFSNTNSSGTVAVIWKY